MVNCCATGSLCTSPRLAPAISNLIYSTIAFPRNDGRHEIISVTVMATGDRPLDLFHSAVLKYRISRLNTAMDPTTLVTFLFKAPPEVRTVELLGSWDNFRQPYLMHHDRRRGTGSWSGCFKFSNIIFDGDQPYWTKPRTGGLKQGGTYWFFYRLNDEAEAYDDNQPFTSDCPLLPGQTVNVIEVPTELLEPPSRCRSASLDVAGTLASLSSMHTLDPGHKYLALDPPPVSKVHGRCISDMALNGRLENTAHSVRSSQRVSPPTSSHLEHPGPAMDCNYAPTRCYAASRSTYSRRSWGSAAPSCAHSSVIDAYGIESPGFDFDNQSDPFALDAPVSRPVTTAADYQDGLSFFDFQAYGSISDAGLEDREERCTSSQALRTSQYSAMTHDSRPTTSHSSLHWRPRLFSFPNSTQDHGEAESTSPSEFSPRQSTEDHSPGSDAHAFDICSPTFSADTLSSGGLNTPFRLSMGYSRTATARTGDEQIDDSIESVAERLRDLDSGSGEDVSRSMEKNEVMFSGYALPHPAGAESVHSLSKISSSGYSGRDKELPPLPSMMEVDQSHQGSSFADAIFSELGYLGGSIA